MMEFASLSRRGGEQILSATSTPQATRRAEAPAPNKEWRLGFAFAMSGLTPKPAAPVPLDERASVYFGIDALNDLPPVGRTAVVVAFLVETGLLVKGECLLEGPDREDYERMLEAYEAVLGAAAVSHAAEEPAIEA